MRLIITKQRKLFTVCTEQVRSPYIEHAASGLPNPTRLEWGGDTNYPGSRPAGVTTRCPRMVKECLLTLSMLIEMYKFTISGYVTVYVHCIYSQSISCRRSQKVTRRRRYNALEIVLHDNKVRLLVTHFSTSNHEIAPIKSIPFQHVTIPATLVCAFYH